MNPYEKRVNWVREYFKKVNLDTKLIKYYKGKNVLVTGGAGAIGSNLCNELRIRGHKVFAVDLYNTERDEYERCDVRNFRQLEGIFDKYGPFDYVYHLAAEYGRWNEEAFYEYLWMTNAIGTRNMIRLQENYVY